VVGVVSNLLYDHSIGKMMVAVLQGMAADGLAVHVLDQISPGSRRDDHVHRFLLHHVVDRDFHVRARAGARGSP
jgi:predicted subunit of tRNA(5-methylaminomethyl-2-thiouridylate) methyltransferase